MPYGGPALKSAQPLLLDRAGVGRARRASAWSAPAWWETGLLSRPTGRAPSGSARTPAPPTRGRTSPSTRTSPSSPARPACCSGRRTRRTTTCGRSTPRTTPGKVLLRPHVAGQRRPSPRSAEIDLSPVITPPNAGEPHHMRIQADGDHDHHLDRRHPGRHPHRRHLQPRARIGFRSLDERRRRRGRALRQPRRARPRRHVAVLRRLLHLARPAVPRAPRSPTASWSRRATRSLLDPEPDAPMLRRRLHARRQEGRDGPRVRVRPRLLRAAPERAARSATRCSRPPTLRTTSATSTTTYDVTGELHRGRERRRACGSGNGYGPRFSPYGFRWTGPKQAIVLLAGHLRRRHAGRPSPPTTRWTWSDGADRRPTTSTPARPTTPGWRSPAGTRPGFDDAGWQPVRDRRRAQRRS